MDERETHVALQEPRVGPFDGDDAAKETEIAYQLRQLTEHPAWSLLAGICSARAAAFEAILLNGKARSLEEYREHAGYARGIRYVLDLPAAQETYARELENERAAAQRRDDL